MANDETNYWPSYQRIGRLVPKDTGDHAHPATANRATASIKEAPMTKNQITIKLLSWE